MKHMKLIALAGFIQIFSAQAASFNCAKAQTQVEKLICSDVELSKQDEKLSTVYTDALIKTGSSPKTIRQAQKRWLKERDGCADVGCIKKAYASRISLLDNLNQPELSLHAQIRASGRKPARLDFGLNAGWDFVQHTGQAGTEDWLEDENDPMCKKVKNYMNRVASKWVVEEGTTRTNYCTPSVRLAPFFSEPPWTELDSRKHEELIMRLMRFSRNSSDYFKPSPSTPAFDEDYFRKQAREFIEAGGRVQHWKTRFTEVFYFPSDGSTKPAPPGDQDVIQLRYQVTYTTGKNPEDSACLRPSWEGSVFLVTEDLKDPLRHLEPMERKSLLVYEGDPVLDSSLGDEIYLKSPRYGHANHGCRLTYPDHSSAGGN